MKKEIHPKNYRVVAFQDMNDGHVFLIPSCVETKETIKHEGTEYPVYKVEISSASHPFYTGKKMTLDTAGRIEKFQAQKQKAEQAKVDAANRATKVRKRKTIEEKVNEALREDIAKEKAKDEKLMAKIKKHRKPEESEATAPAEQAAEIPVEETA